MNYALSHIAQTQHKTCQFISSRHTESDALLLDESQNLSTQKCEEEKSFIDPFFASVLGPRCVFFFCTYHIISHEKTLKIFDEKTRKFCSKKWKHSRVFWRLLMNFSAFLPIRNNLKSHKLIRNFQLMITIEFLCNETPT